MPKETRKPGIERKTRQQLEDLQATLREYPHIEEIHFTESGDHFFNVHELTEVNKAGKQVGKGTGKRYGRFKLEDFCYKTVGERKFYKKVRVHTPETMIVETLTREQVLEYEYSGPEEAGKTPAIASASADPTVAELLRQVTEMRDEMARLRAAKGEEGQDGKKGKKAEAAA